MKMRNPFEIYTDLNSSKSKRPLDWEESAVDTQSSVEEIHDPERTVPAMVWPKLLLITVFLVLAGRIFYLQIVQGAGFRGLSDNNRIRSQSLLAPRGLILDANGEILAQNTASFNLLAVPFDLPKNQKDLDAELIDVANTFLLDKDALASQIKNSNQNPLDPVVAKQDISSEQAILFETRATEFVGFSVQQVPVRDYIDPQIFSHVLGYTGLVSSKDLASLDPKKYDNVDFTGKAGIESNYEKYLHGQNGQNLIEVDASGKIIDVLGQNPPTPGETLQLNIDKGLQEQLYNELKASNTSRSAAVALNPKTGQVLALVSMPGFDNNLFAHGIKNADYQNLLNDKSLPLFNRAIAGVYPPGSTVKPMVATAALTDGIINENTVINDRGVIYIPNQYDPSIQYAFRGWKPGGLGPMTVRSAIALSSDIFFYTVAGGYPNTAVPDGLGPQRLADFYRKFNLGNPTGIDLPGEKPGLVPDPAWKASYFKSDPILSQWYLGDTYHIGIGQGDLLVTPLQVAEWTATIANNGTGMKPEIAERALDANGKTIWQNKPESLISNVAPPEDIKIVQEGMRQTVLAGTATALKSLPITSAGKTGTSQFDGSDPSRTHAWFTAYAPYENPQIVITVLIEAGGEGNAVAEPVVQRTLLWWAQNRANK